MEFVPERLRSGELTAAAGATALLIVSFLPWYGVSLSTPYQRYSLPAGSTAWESFSILDVLLAATIISALALTFFQATRRAPALPVTMSAITTVLSALTAIAVLIRILAPPGVELSPGARLLPQALLHLTRTTKLGAYLGLLALLMIALGAWRSTREEGLLTRDEEPVSETLSLDRLSA